jgi:hypothetical protein
VGAYEKLPEEVKGGLAVVESSRAAGAQEDFRGNRRGRTRGNPTAGKIQLQSEGAEIYYRRVEMIPVENTK